MLVVSAIGIAPVKKLVSISVRLRGSDTPDTGPQFRATVHEWPGRPGFLSAGEFRSHGSDLIPAPPSLRFVSIF